jgi:deoxycytidylate deaminase
LNGTYIENIFRRDQDEGLAFGQHVRNTMQMADFFVRNDGQNDARLKKSIDRFLEIIFGIGIHTPTIDEHAMNVAAGAAGGSACLSRLVGAVIVSKEGEIIGEGANDVPKYGGGLYSTADNDDDHRCFKWKGKICHNDDRKTRLNNQLIMSLKNSDTLKKGKEIDALGIIARSDIRNLIEFSRSVHAEMEAIISVARGAKPGLVGSTLYCTTFPCHSCARHIVASGITRVIYIEPYTKSLALDLHEDAVSVYEEHAGKRVLFLQYEGVAPRNMGRLFRDRGERKKDGKLLLRAKKEASPLSKVPLDGFAHREQLIVAAVRQRESAPGGG